MKSVLITGAAGFIGSNFVNHLTDIKFDGKISIIDKLTYAGNLKNLTQTADLEKMRFFKNDISERATIYNAIGEVKPDLVINFAAESHVDRSISNPSEFANTNIIGTQVLLDACLQFNVGRFVQISTDEVYGSLSPDAQPSREGDMLLPNSPYSASKAAADLLVRSYVKTFGLDAVITRCSNNYGRYQYPEKLIPTIISRANLGTSIPVYGDGLNIRDWIHVKDHCRGIWLAATKGKTGEIYNFGGDNQWTNIDLVKVILKKLGRPESLINYVTDRKGHDLRYDIDCIKSKEELGWIREIALEDGLTETIKWYLNHPNWWK